MVTVVNFMLLYLTTIKTTKSRSSKLTGDERYLKTWRGLGHWVTDWLKDPNRWLHTKTNLLCIWRCPSETKEQETLIFRTQVINEARQNA
jgi:hypothetical protein